MVGLFSEPIVRRDVFSKFSMVLNGFKKHREFPQGLGKDSDATPRHPDIRALLGEMPQIDLLLWTPQVFSEQLYSADNADVMRNNVCRVLVEIYGDDTRRTYDAMISLGFEAAFVLPPTGRSFLYGEQDDAETHAHFPKGKLKTARMAPDARTVTVSGGESPWGRLHLIHRAEMVFIRTNTLPRHPCHGRILPTELQMAKELAPPLPKDEWEYRGGIEEREAVGGAAEAICRGEEAICIPSIYTHFVAKD